MLLPVHSELVVGIYCYTYPAFHFISENSSFMNLIKFSPFKETIIKYKKKKNHIYGSTLLFPFTQPRQFAGDGDMVIFHFNSIFFLPFCFGFPNFT